MLPKYHILFGFLFVILLYLLFPQLNFLALSIIFFSSFLIDVDHMFYYSIKKKNLNPLKAYLWFVNNVKRTLSLPMNERKKIYSGFYIFHGVEWIIILFLLGVFIHPFFTYIGIGFVFHMLVDIPDEIHKKRTFDKFSLIWNYYRFKKTR